MRVRWLVIVALVSCGPRVDESAHDGDGGGEDPGTCESPTAGARVGIARNAGVLSPARIEFLQDGTAIDCDSDLTCALSETLELEAGFVEGKLDAPPHVEDDCRCEDLGTSISDQDCRMSIVEGTTLWIESVTDDCITGSIQERTDDAPTPFVATVCR